MKPQMQRSELGDRNKVSVINVTCAKKKQSLQGEVKMGFRGKSVVSGSYRPFLVGNEFLPG